jgi:uncharacterized membrane protein YuzA (DUF378 family)
MKVVKIVAWVLVLVGALNWGLVGLFDFDLVDYLLNGAALRTVYVLVGLSAIVSLCACKKGCKKSCDSRDAAPEAAAPAAPEAGDSAQM